MRIIVIAMADLDAAESYPDLVAGLVARCRAWGVPVGTALSGPVEGGGALGAVAEAVAQALDATPRGYAPVSRP